MIRTNTEKTETASNPDNEHLQEIDKDYEYFKQSWPACGQYEIISNFNHLDLKQYP